MRRTRWFGGLVGALALAMTAAPAALAGPVILGGDDLTQHGSRNTSTGANEEGWLYMEKALRNLSPNVTRANDNSVAALGSGPAPTETSGDAGAAIGSAAAAAGLTVNYYNSAAEINGFFNSLAAGTARPKIVWIAGNGASNDLSETGCQGAGTEGEAITANAPRLDTFVAQGGGLMSHGTCYTWLAALLPGLEAPTSGSSGDLYLTPEGMAAFPGLTNADVNAGPWHNHFRGNLGGLQVLTRSTGVKEAGADAPVIVGGGPQATLRRVAAPTVRIANARCAGGRFRADVSVAAAAPVTRVDVFRDGRRIRRTNRSRFTVRFSTQRLRRGTHRLRVVATDERGSTGARGVRFRACRAAQRPRFTG